MSARFPGRKLSLVRLGILTGVVVATTAGGVAAWGNFQDVRTAESIPSVFSGYVDVTATPRYAFEDPVSREAENVLLSFIVADAGKACAPSWGAAYSLDEAGSALDLDRRVARLQQLGGTVSISFGIAVSIAVAARLTRGPRLLLFGGGLSSLFRARAALVGAGACRLFTVASAGNQARTEQ